MTGGLYEVIGAGGGTDADEEDGGLTREQTQELSDIANDVRSQLRDDVQDTRIEGDEDKDDEVFTTREKNNVVVHYPTGQGGNDTVTIAVPDEQDSPDNTPANESSAGGLGRGALLLALLVAGVLLAGGGN